MRKENNVAKKYDMRLNVYLDKNEPKDKILIDFFEEKYSPVGFIKETMYALATGRTVERIPIIQSNNIEQFLDIEELQKEEQEYEPIKGADDIEL